MPLRNDKAMRKANSWDLICSQCLLKFIINPKYYTHEFRVLLVYVFETVNTQKYAAGKLYGQFITFHH
jgi:hypothetical protein